MQKSALKIGMIQQKNQKGWHPLSGSKIIFFTLLSYNNMFYEMETYLHIFTREKYFFNKFGVIQLHGKPKGLWILLKLSV